MLRPKPPAIPTKSQERLIPRTPDGQQQHTQQPFNWLHLDGDLQFPQRNHPPTPSPPPAVPPIMEPYRDIDRDRKLPYHNNIHEMSPSRSRTTEEPVEPVIYRTYRKRWFGLFQLILLNVVVSWDWLTFASVSSTSAKYLNVSEDAINWLSNGFLFAFIVAAPASIFCLHQGPKPAIIASACFILTGNWLRWVGAKTAQFPVVMTGQILIGLAQPFVLSAPTTFSDMWFTERGRTTATAVASLANPLGGALGQLLAPAWVSKDNPKSVADMVLYVAIISSIAALPAFFIPDRPPTPASASSTTPKTPLTQTLRSLFTNKSFYLIFIPFIVYVGFFNATSTLINQILSPYGFTEDQSGIAGGILIVVGIIFAIIVSIVNDRLHAYVTIIKILVPITAIAYLAFLFAPPTRSVGAPYVILAILGAASFSLMPVTLEYVVEVTYPIGPESSSVVLWSGGQLLGAVFTIIMAALKDAEGTDPKETFPVGNMQRALLFQAIICCLIAVVPMGLGMKALGLDGDRRKRFIIDGRRTPAS